MTRSTRHLIRQPSWGCLFVDARWEANEEDEEDMGLIEGERVRGFAELGDRGVGDDMSGSLSLSRAHTMRLHEQKHMREQEE